ncbi:MAG: VCBS repeat-containing protein [Myxococcota bacterium]
MNQQRTISSFSVIFSLLVAGLPAGCEQYDLDIDALTERDGELASFGDAVASFAGTLDLANLDGEGHTIVGVSDVTGDGQADLVSASTDGHAYVWPGKASGGFGGSAVTSFAGTLDLANLDGVGHTIVGVSDVTGDGQADLVSASTDGHAYVWPGQASGGFGSAVTSFAGTLDLANLDGVGHFIVGVSDVTGDGHADLVSASTDGHAYVWPGQASGGFGSAVTSFGGTLDLANLDGVGHTIVGVSDVTGDGQADLVSANTDGHAYVWPGQASGGFGGSAVTSFGGTLDLANLDGVSHTIVGVSDVTGDGQADLVSASTDGHAYVWPGRASGEFGSAVTSFAGTLDLANLDGVGHFIVGVSDVTGDGQADLVSANTDGHAYVWPAN